MSISTRCKFTQKLHIIVSECAHMHAHVNEVWSFISKEETVVSRIWPGLVMCAFSNAKVHGIPTLLSPMKPWKKCDQYLCFHRLSFVLLNLITSNILPLPGLCLCFCFILQAHLLYHWEDTIWLLLVRNAIIYIYIWGNCRVHKS